MAGARALDAARVLLALLALGGAGRIAPQDTHPFTPARFLALVARYRQGDLDSLADVARWPQRDITRAVAASRAAEQATARAALVFAIDLARMVPVPQVAALVDASRPLADAVAGNSDPAFRREVVLCQVASLAHAEEFDRAHWLLDAAFHAWPGDPDLLLARGSLWETMFERRSRESLGNQPWAERYESLTLERLAALAVGDLERVLKAASSQPEARLRLGRMLTLRRKYDEARQLLERAQKEADHAHLRYLASLFLGQLHERLAQRVEAEDAYRAAYSEYPAAQAVTLSLAHLLIQRGAQADADALLLAMFQARRTSVEVPDPWRLFDFAQFWRLGERLERLRAYIRP